MAMRFTRNVLQRLGRNLRDSEQPGAKDLELLQEYRLSHKEIVKAVFDVVCEEAYRINQDAICAFRIKRIDSIIRKLQRLKGSLELKSMMDIAGCRCIMSNDDEAFKLMRALRNTPLRLVQEPNIYMNKGVKESGYGSIHLYVTLPGFDNLYVELQIRSIAQHDWATFVETIDLLYDTKIKENIFDGSAKCDDFYKMHQVLSKRDDYWTMDERLYLVNTIIKYDILGRLDSVLVSNIARVRHQWATMMSSMLSPSYFYIEATNTGTSTIQAYASYAEAEHHYYESFENSSSKNQVIVSVKNASYDSICMAYSNYMLVCHKFTHRMHDLFTTVLEENATSYSLINKFYLYYKEISETLTNRIDVEVNEMENSLGKYDEAIWNEWICDVEQNLRDYKSDSLKITRVALKSVFMGNSVGIYRKMRSFYFDVMYFIVPTYTYNKIRSSLND